MSGKTEQIAKGPASWMKTISKTFRKIKVDSTAVQPDINSETTFTLEPGLNQPNQKTRVDIKDFELISLLGVGSFGKVVKAQHRPTKTMYAIKAIERNRIQTLKSLDGVLNEKKILFSLKHPFIVQLHYTAIDAKNLYFVMEYVRGGELYYHLKAIRFFSDEQVRFFASQVVLALEYLHSLNIIHRDIKPENLLLDHRCYLKLTDFGFSKVVTTRTYTWCGTPEYIAPEIIFMKGYGKSVDWWTLGVLMFEMSTGDPPFDDLNHIELYKKIINREFLFPLHLNKNLKNLMQNLLTIDLSRRYGNTKDGVRSIKEHVFFKETDWDAILQKKIPSPYMPTPEVKTLMMKDLMKEDIQLGLSKIHIIQSILLENQTLSRVPM